MRSAGDILGLCHPDTFIFDYLAPSHYHTIYQVYISVSVDSLGVSGEFCTGLVCAANRRLFSCMLFRIKENSTGTVVSLLY